MMRFLTENYNARLEEMKEFCVASRLSKPLSRRLIAFHKFCSRAGAKNASFEPFLYHRRSFYQDRLGPNIGKALKREMMRFAHQDCF